MDKIECNLAVNSEVETNEDKLRKLLFEEEFFPEYWKTMLSGLVQLFLLCSQPPAPSLYRGVSFS